MLARKRTGYRARKACYH